MRVPIPKFVLGLCIVLCSAVPNDTEADSKDSPVSFELAYTADIMSNLRGGIRRDESYLDNLDLLIDIDADSLWGLRNTQVLLHGLYNNGTMFAENIVGDAFVVSNIGTGVEAIRLYEAWINLTYGDSSQVFVRPARPVNISVDEPRLENREPRIRPMALPCFGDGWCSR